MASSDGQRSFLFFVIPLVFLGGIEIGNLLGSSHFYNAFVPNSFEDDSQLERVIQERIEAILGSRPQERKQDCPPMTEIMPNDIASSASSGKSLHFGSDMSYFLHGAARVGKELFLDKFDYGYRRDPPSNDEVLLLYSHRTSLPSVNREAATMDNGNGIPFLSLEDATANCKILEVVSAWGRDKHQCLAVVGQYESFTLQRWEREDSSAPFRAVQTGYPYPPVADHSIKQGQQFLIQYLGELDDVLKNLKPIVQKVARYKAVVVMVSNMGQADLLLNFVCSARAKKYDTSNILVFATDEQTRDMVTGLGLTVYYNEKMFHSFPTEAARGFGDNTFGSMMKAKIVSVHLVNALGFDVLFQDIDIVWFKPRPLDFFRTAYKEFDILFQDEGAMSRKMAPHSANTGYYYVRYNQKTQYMLQQLLYLNDWVQHGRSHQEVVNSLLTIHSAVFGLRVKTLSGEEFPSGAQFHHRKELMKNIALGNHTPWLFHMSWTDSRKDKLLYMKQFGLWYVQERCEGDGAKIRGSNMTRTEKDCCAMEPLVSCHFQDKPSKIPCPNSPMKASNGKPFWA